MTQPLWTPDSTRIEDAALSAFCTRYQSEHPQLNTRDYAEVQRWSVEQADSFWSALWDFCEVIGEREGPVREGQGMPGTRFFPQAQLNFAENLLERGDDEAIAVRFLGEDGERASLTRGEIRRKVASLADHLRRSGLQPGERVAAMMPNRPETLIAMLATASLGAVWSSCSPDFGLGGVLDRFGQIEPTVLLTCAGYVYGGKSFDTREKASQILDKLPSVRRAIMLGNDVPQDFEPWSALMDRQDEPLYYRRMPFNAPLYILYSSGTTGAPKCIVHGIGGTLLQHLKEHRLQADIRPGDRVFYYSTCGWMMWNWLVSALASEACVLLFDGSPFEPSPQALFDYMDETDATFFGVSAKYIDALKVRGVCPRESHRLDHLRALASTGSPLVPESFDYIYRDIKRDIAVQSISGGTDIVSCFVLGNPWSPVYSGQIQGPGLGMDVDVCDDEGRSSAVGVKGDLVCRSPFPCMPIGFWNDPDGQRYRNAYFNTFPGIWHHGDFAEKTAQGGLIIHGRSDATLNPGGVRIGTAEIYRQVEQIPAVIESLAVGQNWRDDVRVVLFVVLAEGQALDDALETDIRDRIRRGASPRHVPARIVAVADLPRTRSGKLAELAVRAVIQGEAVKNLNALANPESLEAFKDIPSLKG